MFVGLVLLVAPAMAQSVTPFSLNEVSRQFDKAGALKSETRFLFAVDRHGSIVSMDLDPSSGAARQILDRVHGFEILINPKTRTASKMPYQVPQRPPEACERRFVSGFGDTRVSVERSAGVIQGVEVERVSVDGPNADSMDVYMAPSLGCQVLRTIHNRDGQVLETRAVNNLRIGDPDANLFRIPEGYRVTGVSFARPTAAQPAK